MQLFLRTQCGLEVSLPTISRQIRKAYGGTFLRNGRCARIRSRKQREAEGRSIALELQQGSGGDNSSPDNGNGDDNDNDDNNNNGGGGGGHQTPAPPGPYHDQPQLAPLEQILEPHSREQDQGQGTACFGGVGQRRQDGNTT